MSFTCGTNAISPAFLWRPQKGGTAGSSVASANFGDLQETAVRTPVLARLLQGYAFLTASGPISKLASKCERVRWRDEALVIDTCCGGMYGLGEGGTGCVIIAFAATGFGVLLFNPV